MRLLDVIMKKYVWNNAELKHKSEQYNRFSIVAMVLIILSAWFSPQYFPDYAKLITLGIIGIAILFSILSWYTERQDSKYVPPPIDNKEDSK